MSKEDVSVLKQLSYAVLHGPIHTPETGQYGPVLSSLRMNNVKAVKMTQLDGEVLVEIPESKDPKKTKKILISNTGFTHRVLVD